MDKANDYFNFVWRRIAFDRETSMMLCHFKDGTSWERIGFGFYWRYK